MTIAEIVKRVEDGKQTPGRFPSRIIFVRNWTDYVQLVNDLRNVCDITLNLAEFSKGDITWLFDKTDMARAKQILGSTCCISGNIPSSMLITATPGEAREYCRKLIEACAPGGGFILSGGAGVDNAKPENIRAIMDAAKEYGVYK